MLAKVNNSYNNTTQHVMNMFLQHPTREKLGDVASNFKSTLQLNLFNIGRQLVYKAVYLDT